MSHAVEAGLRAVEFNPKDTIAHYNLAWYLISAGDFENAEKELQKVLEINPKDEEAFICLALSELAQGRNSRAIEIYEQLKSISPYGESLAILGMADLALFEGRLAEVSNILEKGIASDLKNNYPELAANKLSMLAQAYLIQGKKALAVSTADRAVATSKEPGFLLMAAQIYIGTGRKEKALALQAELNQRLEPEPQAYAKLIEGEIRMSAGDSRGAISLFQEARKILDTWLGRFVLGQSYLEAKAFTEAHSEFELCLKRRGEAASIFLDDTPTYRYFPPVYYYLGRAQEGLGSPAAAESYRTFLKIKEKDEGDPLVKDARLRLSKISN